MGIQSKPWKPKERAIFAKLDAETNKQIRAKKAADAASKDKKKK